MPSSSSLYAHTHLAFHPSFTSKLVSFITLRYTNIILVSWVGVDVSLALKVLLVALVQVLIIDCRLIVIVLY